MPKIRVPGEKKMSAAAFGALGTTQAVSSMFVDVPWGERAI